MVIVATNTLVAWHMRNQPMFQTETTFFAVRSPTGEAAAPAPNSAHWPAVVHGQAQGACAFATQCSTI